MRPIVRFSIQNSVLLNLLMLAVIVGGFYASLAMVREMFPESRPNRVLVTTRYPGATPLEIEKGITQKLEEKVRDVPGVEKARATVTEGFSRIVVEMEGGSGDIEQAVNDIKAAIDTIPPEDFPEEAEETSVVEFEPTWPVIGVAITGNVDERTRKHIGYELRDEILEIPDVTEVLLTGTRNDEISVEADPTKLVKFDLSLLDVGRAIAASNLDIPGGQLRTGRANIAVRTLGETDRREKLREIIIQSDPSGRVVQVGDVAEVVDGFEDIDLVSRFGGKPAANVTVYKTPEQDAVAIAARVRALVAGKLGRPLEQSWWDRKFGRLTGGDVVRQVYERARANPLPPEVDLSIHTDLSRFIKGRLDLLRRNGAWGMLLVALSLIVFLHWNVALWVILGVALALGGALGCLHWMGQTLNMFTMLGVIIVLGMLVDDAIIVGEHVFTRVERGELPALAAVEGTNEVAWPVICAVLTTIVAFIPLRFIEGQVGDWVGVLPIVVCVALAASLIESVTVLPCHLAHGLRPAATRKPTAARRLTGRFGEALAAVGRARTRLLHERGMRWYEAAMRALVGHRYVTIAGLCACLIIALGAVRGGHVPYVFLEDMDTENLKVDLSMEVGTPIEGTERAASVLERAALELPELRTLYTIVGAQLDDEQAATAPQPHLAQVWMEISPPEERSRTSTQILQALRTATQDIPGASKLTYAGLDGGPAGAEVHLEISGARQEDLVAAAGEIKHRLARFDGIDDIVDDYEMGRREVQIELLESGRALGLTTQSLAAQVRAAFYGYEARKVQRGREDVKIMVRFPPEERARVSDLEGMRVATPDGVLVPILEVARVRETTGFASVRRVNQRRAVTVTADVNSRITNASRVVASLSQGFPELSAQYRGVEFTFGGQKLETQKALASLETDFLAAVVMIYVILAGLFRSYVQPLIVMAVIPFGFIGAVVGHFLLGYPLTILSLIGLVALAGVVVNDSMVLVAFVNRAYAARASALEAVIEGGKQRIRPILLTTVTTVLGIAPLLMERSFQARFLIPMAVSISAGLVFATVLTLVIVPCLYVMLEDARGLAAAAARMLTGAGAGATPRTDGPAEA